MSVSKKRFILLLICSVIIFSNLTFATNITISNETYNLTYVQNATKYNVTANIKYCPSISVYTDKNNYFVGDKVRIYIKNEGDEQIILASDCSGTRYYRIEKENWLWAHIPLCHRKIKVLEPKEIIEFNWNATEIGDYKIKVLTYQAYPDFIKSLGSSGGESLDYSISEDKLCSYSHEFKVNSFKIVPVVTQCIWCGTECVSYSENLVCPSISPPKGYNCTYINSLKECKKVPNIKLSIKTDKSIYQQGETIKITVKNVGELPLRLPSIYNNDYFEVWYDWGNGTASGAANIYPLQCERKYIKEIILDPDESKMFEWNREVCPKSKDTFEYHLREGNIDSYRVIVDYKPVKGIAIYRINDYISTADHYSIETKFRILSKEPDDDSGSGGGSGGEGSEIIFCICGNRVCEKGENHSNCPQDCPLNIICKSLDLSKQIIALETIQTKLDNLKEKVKIISEHYKNKNNDKEICWNEVLVGFDAINYKISNIVSEMKRDNGKSFCGSDYDNKVKEYKEGIKGIKENINMIIDKILSCALI